MEMHVGIKTYYAKDRKVWRNWLQKNGEKERSVWLILYRKETSKKSICYAEAVEDALCFGWIDSKANKRDDESSYLYFAKRNPKSNWSKINKERVAQMIAQGLMNDKGMELIEQAKLNGAWQALDAVDNLELPNDLKDAFNKNRKAAEYFEQFPSSVKKGILEWIQNAKREETRQKRIIETVTLAMENIRANQYKAK